MEMDRIHTRKGEAYKGSLAFEKFIYVDTSFIGLIIGVGGSQIKKVQHKYSVSITVD